MKIGILTFHIAQNYGAVLQCYALQETLKSLGHEVEVIDYRPDYLVIPYKWFDIHHFISKNPITFCKKLFSETSMLRCRYLRYTAFRNFCIHNLNLSAKVLNRRIPEKYDVYIMGSDQIWNPKITHGFDSVYFGYLGFSKGNKKYIAYAASMEAKEIDQQSQNFYKSALNNFNAISVRENQLGILLKPLTDKNVEVVIDPTLLADSNVWTKIIKKPTINQKYVLVYQTRVHDRTLQIANNVAKQIGATVIEVASYIYKSKHVLQTVSPEEFLGLVKYASCIVTTSFHGTAFSVIFKRPFYCLRLTDGRDTRSESLLTSIGLIERMINPNIFPKFTEIDYNESFCKKIINVRKLSMHYLKTSLNN